MGLRRGFKTEAQLLAKSLRQELNVQIDAPLDPFALANHLEIPLIKLSEMRTAAPNAASWFSSSGQSDFSAVTVFEGFRRVIVYNDSHSPGRQSNDIAHELAHGILLHTPGPAMDAYGCRHWNEDMENEADWLAGVLLISDDAAIHIVRMRMDASLAIREYGVSRPLLEWRLRMSGAKTRVARAANWFARNRSF
jgi:Zn-dependent peptidase ImmA (M78 family)